VRAAPVFWFPFCSRWGVLGWLKSFPPKVVCGAPLRLLARVGAVCEGIWGPLWSGCPEKEVVVDTLRWASLALKNFSGNSPLSWGNSVISLKCFLYTIDSTVRRFPRSCQLERPSQAFASRTKPKKFYHLELKSQIRNLSQNFPKFQGNESITLLPS